ncbi:hypothetical protein TorRG33x02_275120 [Trema orientale]|uniref:Uncharacterized protein n=1 Tax=Trema orientale TaxID=63057 RepID=A0A2P5CS17_TREOI|nr:hypothetical protein TorRG33x02_275120 [Trema orientale]
MDGGNGSEQDARKEEAQSFDEDSEWEKTRQAEERLEGLRCLMIAANSNEEGNKICKDLVPVDGDKQNTVAIGSSVVLREDLEPFL